MILARENCEVQRKTMTNDYDNENSFKKKKGATKFTITWEKLRKRYHYNGKFKRKRKRN